MIGSSNNVRNYSPGPVPQVEDPGKGEAPKGSWAPQVVFPVPLGPSGKPGCFDAVRLSVT